MATCDMHMLVMSRRNMAYGIASMSSVVYGKRGARCHANPTQLAPNYLQMYRTTLPPIHTRHRVSMPLSDIPHLAAVVLPHSASHHVTESRCRRPSASQAAELGEAA